MQCPKCQGELEAKTFASMSYNRCADCGGIMITPRELRRAKQTLRSYDIMDVGSPRRGRKLDAITEIECPFCDDHPRMNTIRDAQQPHIRLEQCPECERLYFDAGEFTDKHRETLWDKVLDMLAQRSG